MSDRAFVALVLALSLFSACVYVVVKESRVNAPGNASAAVMFTPEQAMKNLAAKCADCECGTTSSDWNLAGTTCVAKPAPEAVKATVAPSAEASGALSDSDGWVTTQVLPSSGCSEADKRFVRKFGKTCPASISLEEVEAVVDERDRLRESMRVREGSLLDWVLELKARVLKLEAEREGYREWAEIMRNMKPIPPWPSVELTPETVQPICTPETCSGEFIVK